MALVLLLAGAPAQQPVATHIESLPAAQAIPAMTQELLDALPGRPAVWERYLSDRIVYVSEAGVVATKPDLLKGFAPFPEGLAGSIAVRNPRITEFGDTAICVFDAYEKQTVYDQQIEVNYRATHTWRRESGNWRLIAAHNAVLAKDPPSLPVDASRWKNYTGTYQLGGKRRFIVELRDGVLMGGAEGAPPARLIPVGENVFVDAGNPLGILRIFLSDGNGPADRFIQRRKFADVAWTRVR